MDQFLTKMLKLIFIILRDMNKQIGKIKNPITMILQM